MSTTEIKLWNGGRFDLWLEYHDYVKELVHGLDPVRVGHFGGTLAAAPKATAIPMSILVNPRGGMRIPHLHFGDDVYIVDRQRWNTFTQRVMQDLGSKISSAGHVSFDNLMNLQDAVTNFA